MIESVSRRQVVSAVGVGTVASLTGCLFGNEDDEPDPIIVSVNSDHDAEHTVDITVTDPDGEAVFESSVTLSGESNEIIGEFVPESPGERETYTISATLDGEASKSLAFPVGGASGTTETWVTITSGGTLELNHNTV
jgi:hypothetical protein